jgi:hypothetical protein
LIPNHAVSTAPAVYGTPFGELLPLGVAAVIVIGGYAFFRRESPWFAERS